MVEKTVPFSTLIASQPLLARSLVRSALGLNELQQLYRRARASGEQLLSQAVLTALSVRVRVDPADLVKIPMAGPVVVVANHPFGLLDGLVLHWMLGRTRPDVKIMANKILCDVDELTESFIGIDVFAPRGDVVNVTAVRRGIRWLADGHGLAVFPSGTVSHWTPNEKRVVDPEWQHLATRCAIAARAPVIPIYFDGRNSLAFQMLGLVHPSLRTARLPKELLNKRDTTVEVRIGTPITPRELIEAGDERAATAHIRARVYLLRNRIRRQSEHTAPSLALPKRIRTQKAICEPVRGLLGEIQTLDESGKRVVENSSYAVYAEIGHRIPLLVRELGRLRELTFREAREGTGKSSDLDEFDASYTHLILWHKQSGSVAGSYRLAWTRDIPESQRTSGLYTSKLFRYSPQFFSRIGPAVELGRSFITRPHQREYAPLLLLWQAIGSCLALRPDSPVLFGAVSVSTAYPKAAKELITEFLRTKSFREDLSCFVTPRRPFRSSLIPTSELKSIVQCLQNVVDLPIQDLGVEEGVPVLLRHYLHLGGKIAAFNIDSRFSDVLDALLVLDLRLTPRKLLRRYMRPELLDSFLRDEAGMLAR